MRRTPVWLAFLVTATLALGGCSDDSDGSGSDPTTDSEPTATEPGDTTPPAKAELRSALLTLEDMPAGWSVGDYDPESKDNICPAEIAGPARPRQGADVGRRPVPRQPGPGAELLRGGPDRPGRARLRADADRG